MKIAVVHSFYASSSPSGENLAVTIQAKALRRFGHEVKVIGRHTDQLSRRPGYRMRSGLTVLTGQGPSPRQEIDEFQPDLVHVHNLFPNWSTAWLKTLALPVVTTIHNFRPVCAAGTLLRDGSFCELCPTKGSHHAVLNACYKDSALSSIPLALTARKERRPALLEHSDFLIFLSQRSRETYANYGLGFPEKSTVIPNFVEPATNAARGSFSEREQFWIYAGRLSPEKGILDLIRHWPADRELRVVGTGTDEQACRKASVGKKVKFEGQMDRDSLQILLSKATGLVFPSTCQENSPLIYLEALSWGLPVVALVGNVVADDVAQSGTGIVVNFFAEFERAVVAVEAERKSYSEAARSRFFRRFGPEAWRVQIEGLYEKILASKDSICSSS